MTSDVQFVVLDMEALEELKDSLDPEDTVEIVECFLEELEELCNAIKSAFESEDKASEKSIAHQIKGCASSACAKSLATIAAQIERGEIAHEEMALTIERLSDTFDQTRQALSRHFNLESV